MSDKNLGYSPENARSAEQAESMKEAAAKKSCIFCDIDFEKNKPLNKLGEFDPEGKDWPLLWVWENPFPQEHHAHHIIILPKRHFNNENFNDEITDAEWLQILDARKWACKFFNIKGGGAVDRFGERALNAGTVGHWHYQLQIPDGTGNVKATFFKDKSPAEQARRANRAVYSNKKLEYVDGYIVKNKHGESLSENLRWVDERFVHACDALGHIYLALKNWGEQITEIIPARASKTLLSTMTTGDPLKPWELFARKAVEISTLAIAKYENPQVLLYQNSVGYFLDDNFNWSPKPHYFHWHAERYIEEALKLSNDEVPTPKAFYLNKGEEPSLTVCDSLNWIDDSEEFDIG